jgi:O-acetyl-ADP-ribose deacetylase (regulator of RNase III)
MAGRLSVEVLLADITALDVDAIVDVASKSMRGVCCLAANLHRAALAKGEEVAR